MCLFCGQFYVPLVSCIGYWMLDVFVLWSIACSSGQFIGYWMLDVFVLWSILCSCGQLYWLLDVRCVCFVVNFIFIWSVVLAIGC